MSKEDKYLQFPLSLLTQTKIIKGDFSHYERMRSLTLAWSMDYAGSHYLEEIRNGEYSTPFEEDHRQYWDDYDGENESHLRLAWGADVMDLSIRSFRHTVKELETAQRITADYEKRFGRPAYVRLSKELFFEARDEPHKMSPRNLLCFCGLMGILGDATYKKIAYKSIQYAAHGCKHAKCYHALIEKPWLTYKQVRQGIEAMELKGFFHSVTIDNQSRYYSNKMGYDDLENAVTAGRTHRREKLLEMRRARHISTRDL